MLRNMDGKDRHEFRQEFVNLFVRCSVIGDWSSMYEFLDDWQATALAYQNPDLLEAWRTRGKVEDYELLHSD